MITLIHGDLIEASRNELLRIKTSLKGKEIRHLDGRTLSEESLTQALESESLFGDDTVVIIEQLFGKLGKKTKMIHALATILVRAGSSRDIILWEDKEVGATVVKSLGSPMTKLYKIPQLLFQFLDGIAPRKAASSLILIEKLVASNAIEIVFVMLVRRVKYMIQVKDGVMPDGLQAWQIGRLTAQARLFTMEKLVSMHSGLVEIDIAVKTGRSLQPLLHLVEQWIIHI